MFTKNNDGVVISDRGQRAQRKDDATSENFSGCSELVAPSSRATPRACVCVPGEIPNSINIMCVSRHTLLSYDIIWCIHREVSPPERFEKKKIIKIQNRKKNENSTNRESTGAYD